MADTVLLINPDTMRLNVEAACTVSELYQHTQWT